MGFMKSLFGNKGVQQEIPEKKIIIRDVGPNPAQVISIIQNYYPEDADQVSMLVNENMMEGNATVCRLSPTESLYELQQALDAAGALTFIQKNWTDEENARAIADIVIFSLGGQPDQVMECYHEILGLDRRDLELKLLKDISDENGFLISTTRERAETLKAALDELGADAEIDVTWDEDAQASLIVFSTGNMKEYLFSDVIRRAYLHVVSKEISGANFKDISDEEPAIIDGVCSSLVYLRDEIDRAGGETVIVFDTDQSVAAALYIIDVGSDKSKILKILQKYLGISIAEANEQVNELVIGKSQVVKGYLGLLKDMKKELDALRVKTELMLDFEEEEDEEFENFSALHCNNCGAELASGTKFCPKCGTKVEEAQKMFCQQCGNEIMPGAKFCTKCGARCM